MKSDIQLLKEKIAVVEADLEKTTIENGSEKKRITLIDYIAYLKDELRMLEDKARANKT